MSRADLYRWASDPTQAPTVPQRVIDSACFRIIQQDPERWDEELDNRVCLNWCVALRSALRSAYEAYRLSTHSSGGLLMYEAEMWGRRYVAVTIIREIIRNMFREDAPREERV